MSPNSFSPTLSTHPLISTGQVAILPLGLWLCPPVGWCWSLLVSSPGSWSPAWSSSFWRASCTRKPSKDSEERSLGYKKRQKKKKENHMMQTQRWFPVGYFWLWISNLLILIDRLLLLLQLHSFQGNARHSRVKNYSNDSNSCKRCQEFSGILTTYDSFFISH